MEFLQGGSGGHNKFCLWPKINSLSPRKIFFHSPKGIHRIIYFVRIMTLTQKYLANATSLKPKVALGKDPLYFFASNLETP